MFIYIKSEGSRYINNKTTGVYIYHRRRQRNAKGTNDTYDSIDDLKVMADGRRNHKEPNDTYDSIDEMKMTTGDVGNTRTQQPDLLMSTATFTHDKHGTIDNYNSTEPDIYNKPNKNGEADKKPQTHRVITEDEYAVPNKATALQKAADRRNERV